MKDSTGLIRRITGQAGPTIPALLFLFTFGYTLFEAARVATVEEAVCRRLGMGNNLPLDIDACRKDHDAQARIASLNGWIDCATYVQALVVTMPNTWLAQKMDKHMLLVVGAVTSVLSIVYFYSACHLSGSGVLPLDMIIFFHLFEIVGGGILMAYVLLNSLLAARTTVESRASIFYITGTVLILARAGGTALCGAFLQFWPRAVGPTVILTYLSCIPVILLFRDGRRSSTSHHLVFPRRGHESEVALLPEDSSSSSSRISLLDDVDGSTHQDGDDSRKPASPVPAPASGTTDSSNLLIKYLSRVLPSTISSAPIFRYGLLFHALATLGTDVQMVQAQWTVNRFAWTYSAVAYVNLYTALVVLLVLSVLPLLSARLRARMGGGGSAQKTEFVVLVASMAFRVAGTVGMGLAPGRATFLVATAVQALSGGALDTLKAFLTGFISPETESSAEEAAGAAELYAAMTLVETGMHVVGSRMWAYVLIVSLRRDSNDSGLGIVGLPFWMSTGFSLAALVLTFAMARYKRPPPLPSLSSRFAEGEEQRG